MELPIRVNKRLSFFPHSHTSISLADRKSAGDVLRIGQCFDNSFSSCASMAWSSLFQTTTRPDLHVCASCALKFSRQTSRRWISQKFLAKVADAELKWQEQALEIRQGKRKSMLTTLEDRGLVHSVTGYGFHRKPKGKLLTGRKALAMKSTG